MEKLMGKIQENMIRFMVKEVPEDEPGLETEEAVNGNNNLAQFTRLVYDKDKS
ncbi:MAG: hypothetical protein ACLURV_01995 [Gallintestinimicrobium sp.]